VYLNWVAPRYFETLGIPVVTGRDFSPHDTPDSPRVAIINQTLAHRWFGTETPIGRRVSFGDNEVREIVGVVGDSKYLEVREQTPPTLYLDTFQEKSPGSEFEIRTAGDAATVISAVRHEFETEAKGVAIGKVRTLASQVGASIVQERLVALLSACFGGLALLIAAVGL
jgi:putative ABC transport system permease protein